VFTVPWAVPGVWERYLKTLYEDTDALDLPCTARAIIYTGFLAGAVVSAVVKAWLLKEVTAFGDWSVHVPTMEVIKGT
jgi:hypothetical protein